MYVHVLYVCACIFQYAFPPDMPVRFSWRKTCPKCYFPKSWQINFCWWVNVCMCLYCMYVYVSYVYVCIVVAGTRITAASPNDRLLRRHPAGLTQGIPGHGRKHFFPPSLYPPTTRFRAPPPSSPVGGPWTAPPARLVGVPGQIRACRPGPKPHPSPGDVTRAHFLYAVFVRVIIPRPHISSYRQLYTNSLKVLTSSQIQGAPEIKTCLDPSLVKLIFEP